MEEDCGQDKLLGTSKTFEQDVQNTWHDQLAPFVSAQPASFLGDSV